MRCNPWLRGAAPPVQALLLAACSRPLAEAEARGHRAQAHGASAQEVAITSAALLEPLLVA